jgi:hypothetical protein
MKNSIFFYTILAVLVMLNSCKKDTIGPNDDEPNLNNPILQLENERLDNVVPNATVFAFLQGYVEDEFGNPLADATVKVSGITKTTDANGYFLFEGIDLNESYAMVRATKEGYHKNFRTFTPKANTVQTVKIQLLSKGISKSFNSNSGGNLEFEGGKVKLNFPEKSIIKANGNAYNGNVNVIARYIDPESDNLLNVMPGMLAGLTDEDEIAAMITYGMVTVELSDNDDNALEVNPDSKVEVRLPASASSPAEIPLWHFNETYGLWIEAGTAIKIGSEYVGEVNHFSTWNLDYKVDPITVYAKVVNDKNVPIPNVVVWVYNSDFSIEYANVYTDNEGEFTLIRSPQELGFKVIFECETVNILPQIVGDSMIVIVDEQNLVSVVLYTLNGTVSDCEDLIYGEKWISINSATANLSFFGRTDVQGQFTFSSILCDINTSIPYTLNSKLYIDGTAGLVKELSSSITFTGSIQDVNINFCGVEEDTISDTTAVFFPDPNLEQAVRNALGQPNGPLLYGSVREIDSLSANLSEINDLNGIEYLIGLKHLDLIANQISDINPLFSLVNLERLNLFGNQISDISSLASCLNLMELNIGDNQISDISPIENLENLEILFVRNNLISDFSPLEDLVNLVYLDLHGNRISNVSSLTNMLDLELLILSKNNIVDISPLANLVSLIKLVLSENDISNISPLANLENLTNLNLYDNRILNLTPLCNIETLNYVNLSSNTPQFTPTQQSDLEACLPSTDIDW